MSVRNGFVLFLALSTLSLLVGCGSSNNASATAPPSGSYSASSLNGTYVFSTTGSDVNNAFLALAGTFVANGSGTITGGTMDIVGAEVTLASPVAQSVTGSYSVSVDGRGQAKLISAGNNFTLDFVLTSSSHGLVTEYDGNGTGSGTLDLQSSVTSLSQLEGSYAFSLSGIDTSGNIEASAGSFTLDGSGNITAGVQDVNDDAIPYLALPINAITPVVQGSGTGPYSVALNTTTFGTLTFDVYPISTTHFKMIETDQLPELVGDAYSQTGATIPTGQVVFTVAGYDSAGPVAAGGVFTSDGTGNFTAGLEDLNNGGTVASAQISFSGTPTAAAGVGGRVVVTLTGFVPATQMVIYPSAGGLLMLETDSTALLSGAAFAQTSTTLAASEGYGFDLSGINTGQGFLFEEDDIAEFVTSATGFTGIVDMNDYGNLTFDQPFAGTYPIAVDSTGRGGVSTTSGSTGLFNYYFYVVNSNTYLLLEIDNNQIGVGTFETQSAPGAAAAAKSAVAMFRPSLRPRAALHKKQ
jgi:hypothetical protein